LYVIKLFPIRAKLKTQKLATILDHVAHSPHVEGTIVVIIDILKPLPFIELDSFHSLMVDPKAVTASLLFIRMTNRNHRIAIIAE
jgi:hypothetical protein